MTDSGGASVYWYCGSALVSINEVTLRQARLVLGWVTGPGFNLLPVQKTYLSM